MALGGGGAAAAIWIGQREAEAMWIWIWIKGLREEMCRARAFRIGERETLDRGTEGGCGRLRSTTLGGDPWAAS